MDAFRIILIGIFAAATAAILFCYIESERQAKRDSINAWLEKTLEMQPETNFGVWLAGKIGNGTEIEQKDLLHMYAVWQAEQKPVPQIVLLNDGLVLDMIKRGTPKDTPT